jgi:uncharacterized protein
MTEASGLQLRRAAALQWEPWRNGQGLSLPLFAGSAEAGAPEDWRISVARIDRDAPYSDFSGYARAQVLLSGGPLLLREGAAAEAAVCHRLDAPGQRIEFAGSAQLHAEIESPCLVFNTALRLGRGQLRSWLRPVLGVLMLPLLPDTRWFGYVLGGQMLLRRGEQREWLHQGDAFALEPQAVPRAVIDGGGSLALAQWVA